MTRKRNSNRFDKEMPLTYRYYLSDARFLVALGAKRELLETLDQAIHTPKWPLFLGRRSCPPDYPLSLGIHDEYADVRQALDSEPWHAANGIADVIGSPIWRLYVMQWKGRTHPCNPTFH